MRTLNDLSLGERLLISRKRAGLTSRQMSARLRVAPNTISSWEADRTAPGYLQTLAWADACGIEPDTLDPDIRNRCSDRDAGTDVA